MTVSLYSAQWYRVARVRPLLSPQVRVQRQHWRDQRWYVLSDEASGRHHRINEAAYQFVGRCDGERSVHEVWAALLEQVPEQAPTQDEVLQLLAQLGELGLMQTDLPGDTQAQAQGHAQRQRARKRAMLNPFSFRLPLFDPHALLKRHDRLAKALFSPLAAALWLLGVAGAALLAALEAPALASHSAQAFSGTRSLLLVWLCYPLLKTVHEAAHALAVQRYGGEVHEAGLGLMFLVPAPYVDASAASAMTQRVNRAVVGAAGVAAELAVAAAGLLLWWLTQPGWVHDAGFVLAAIGLGSTLLFNGNPLLRFDAYYVLCDLFELPNLASRSAGWWGAQLSRRLLGARTEVPAHAHSERKWLVAYAPLSLAWRVGLSVAVVLWLGGQWLLVGVAALAYVLFTVLLKPLSSWARQALDAAQPGREQARVRARLGTALAVLALLLFVLPLPFSTVAPAVVWLPEKALARPEVEGFVAELPLPDGAQVKVGDLLVRLVNPELVSAREQLASRLEGLKVEHYQVLMRDPNAAQNLALDLERTQAELLRAQTRLAQLDVRAQTHGTLVMPRQADWQGAFVRQGQTLGHVLGAENLRVRAAVAQADAHLIRQRVHAAQVRLADAPAHSFAATLTSDTPAATRDLPSAALADVGGGPYASDPTEKNGTKSLEPVFLFDLNLGANAALHVGARAWVRFEHGHEALAVQGYRRAAQLFLQHFSPSG